MAEPLAEEVGQDLVRAYQAFKRGVVALVASGQPAEAKPVTDRQLTVSVDGRDVEVCRTETTMLHFNFDPQEDRWRFAYELTEGCNPFLVRHTLLPGETGDQSQQGR